MVTSRQAAPGSADAALAAGLSMAPRPTRKRTTFHHGNLAEALIAAALRRVEAHGVDSITVRDLARDTGVNHRAIYRHFPDKDALMASVAEGCWRDFIRFLRKSIAGMPPGEPLLVACGMATCLYGRNHPNR